MRKSAIRATFLVVLILPILTFCHCKKTHFEIANPDYPGQPVIIFVLDSRNTQSVKFITDSIEYLNRNWLFINVGIIFLNTKVVSFNGSYKVYEKKIIHGLSDYQDSFLLFSSEGKLLEKGSLSDIPDSLLHQINPQYALDNQRIIADICQTVDTLEDISFFSNMKSYPYSDFTCFLFFGQICLCNNSVNAILKVMEIEEHRSEVHHFIVPMFEYSKEEISLIKNNNGFLVDFISPGFKDLKRWESLSKDPLHKHPLSELIVLADKQGKILLFSNKWEDYMAWREEHLEKKAIRRE